MIPSNTHMDFGTCFKLIGGTRQDGWGAQKGVRNLVSPEKDYVSVPRRVVNLTNVL